MLVGIRNASAKRWAAVFSFEGFSTILLLLCAAVALLFLAQAARFLPVVGDNSYPESAAALATQRWVQGSALYSDYRQPPYLVTAFPPLWYALLSIPARLGFSDLDSVTLFGRLLNLTSLLGVAALGFYWNRRLGLSLRIALATPAIYLCFPILIPWAVTVRPDFPSLFFALIALCLVANKESAGWICLAGVSAAAAFLIRHNAVAVPLVSVLWLVWLRRWKHAALFCVAWGVVVGSTLTASYLSSGGLLLLNLSGAKFGRLAVTYSRDSLLRLLVSPGHGFAVVLFIFGGMGFLYCWSDIDKRLKLLGMYLVVTLGFAVLGSAAAGGDVNHYLEPGLAMAMLAAIALERLRVTWRSDSPISAFSVIAVLVLLLPSVDMQRWKWMHERPVDLRGFVHLVQAKKVFTDIPFLAARMKPPGALDLASLSYAARSGGWSSETLVSKVELKEYDGVILTESLSEAYDPTALYPRYPHLDPPLRAALEKNYGLCFEVSSYFVYGPRLGAEGSGGNKCPSLVKTAPQE
jgi:hypothetical protein